MNITHLIPKDNSTFEVTLDSPVTVTDFARYIALVYGEVIGNSTITTSNITGYYRRGISGTDQADILISGEENYNALVVMGTRTPRGAHSVQCYYASGLNFLKLTRKLEDICSSQ